MTDLERQLHQYGEYQIELRDPLSPEGIGTSSLSPAPPLWSRSRLLVALGAALLVLLSLGVLPFVLGGGEQTSVDEPPQTTVPTTETTAPTTETTAPNASGGPRLGFVEVAAPEDLSLRAGAPWIGERLYMLGAEGVYSTGDGLNWDLEHAQQLAESTLSGSTVPVVATIHRQQPERPCGWTWAERIEVSLEGASGDWITSDLPLVAIPEERLEVGCFGIWVSSVTQGPGGIVVTAQVQGEIDYWSMVDEVLGGTDRESGDGFSGSEPISPGLEFEEYTFVVQAEQNGTSTEVDLRAHGFGDAIIDTLYYARDELGLPVHDAYWLGEMELAWWSPDGVTWTPLDWSEFDVSRVTSAVATEDGFIVTAAGNDANGVLATSDGLTWVMETGSEPLVAWRDQIVVASNGRLYGAPDTVVVSAPPGEEVWRFYGPIGVVGVAEPGPYFRVDEPMFFTADGAQWSTWVPEDLAAFGELAQVAAVGDEFVLVRPLAEGPDSASPLLRGTIAEP